VGVTILIPQKKRKPLKDQRVIPAPVTCLPAICRTVTSVTGKRMQKYIDDKNVLPK
jgi:hypothetical protein